MKKLKSYRFWGLLLLLSLSTACGKEEVEPITVPDTIIEDITEQTPTETVIPTATPTPSLTFDELFPELPETTPAETTGETYAFWDQIHDYSKDQQALTSCSLVIRLKNFTLHGSLNPPQKDMLTLRNLPVNL